jgi:hypothetical protein
VISGFFRGSSPRVVARIALAGLSERTLDVEFLIDTGAAVTVLQLGVLVDLEADESKLRLLPVEPSFGLGGRVTHAVVRGELTFSREDGTAMTAVVRVRLTLTPSAGPDAPSVLGMDVLGAFRVVVSEQEGRAALEDPFT